MKNYSIGRGRIISETGIPCAPRFLADNRLVCEIDGEGIGSISYFSPRTRGNVQVFSRCFWGGMRFFLEEQGKIWPQQLTHVELLPFGMEAVWDSGGFRFDYRIAVRGDSVFAVLHTPPGLPADFRFRLEFYDDFAFVPQKTGDPRFKSSIERTWGTWVMTESGYLNSYREEESGVAVCIGATFPLTTQRSDRNPKNRLFSNGLLPEKTYAFVLSVGEDCASAQAECRRARRDFEDDWQQQLTRYTALADRLPVLESPYPYLNDFFAVAPLYHEALKVLDVPGALRAKTTFYWVWGWDGMTANDAVACWGERDFLRQLLDFYRDYADDKHGIAHAFLRNMAPCDFCGKPAQGMYITVLYLYASNGGDIGPYYAFAARIFRSICKEETGGLGLCRGTSLFPDFRSLLDETGEDISGFNNTVFYCAARSMAFLAGLAGDAVLQQQADGIAARIEKNFLPLFFDEEKGYIASSIHEKTLEKRNVFNANAIKWENAFCDDLVGAVGKRCLGFFERHIVTPAGLREIPAWCHAFDRDANQLHCWWPVTGEYYARLINRYDRAERVEQWIGWVSYWQEKLLCPEGISCYADTAAPPLDNWNCLNGTWQAYSVRGFYQAAVHAVVGIDADFGGLTVYPYSGRELRLYGLHYRDGTVDIAMYGSGPFAEYIEINGKVLTGTHKIPADWLTGRRDTVKVYRTAAAPVRQLAEACGIRLSGWNCTAEGFRVILEGYTRSTVKLRLAEGDTVRLDGVPAAVHPLDNGVSALETAFSVGRTRMELIVVGRKR